MTAVSKPTLASLITSDDISIENFPYWSVLPSSMVSFWKIYT
jgi:hypothetical protein